MKEINHIQELAEQARTSVPAGLDVAEWIAEYNRIFAKLIVQKCAEIAKSSDADDGDDYKSGRVWAGHDILKHFGLL